LKPASLTLETGRVVNSPVDETSGAKTGPAEIAELEAALRHTFARRDLLEQALTHTSRARERDASSPTEPRAVDNEQLEFLGDALLGFVTAENLYRRFPNFREGELSKLRAHLVSEKHLIGIARELRLGNYLRLGKGEEKSGGRKKTTLLVDALEAVLGAAYLDAGIEPPREFIVRQIIDPELERIARSGVALPTADYKSTLQEKLQAAGRPQPVYVLVKENGQEHNKTFTMEARLQSMNGQGNPEYVGRASGSTKKSAEQESARQVLEYLASAAERDNPQPPRPGTT
jgi:ribonuclease-3